jgi:hypothetical protein
MYADLDGWCFPKQSTIGEDLEKSRQTVNQDIAALVAYGYVEKQEQFREDGSQRASKYRLLHDSTGGVGIHGHPVSNLPDTNNDSMNDSYNTANGENSPMPSTKFNPAIEELPLEWQIAAGVTTITQADQKVASYKDSANLISMGTGSFQKRIYDLAYAFMATRNITIPFDDAKGNRKIARKMVSMGVQPHHIVDAVQFLSAKAMTCVDLYSVSKIAIGYANPQEEDWSGAGHHIEGL